MNTINKKVRYRWLYQPIEPDLTLYNKAKIPVFFRIHAATVEMDEKVIVFAGHSGNGKSTVYKLLTDSGFTGFGDDEAVILLNENNQWVLHDALVTIDGESVITAERVHRPIGLIVYLGNHLRKGFLLKKCSNIQAARLGFKRLFLSLLPEWEIMFRNISKFSRDIPAYVLDFSLSTDFIPELRYMISK